MSGDSTELKPPVAEKIATTNLLTREDYFRAFATLLIACVCWCLLIWFLVTAPGTIMKLQTLGLEAFWWLMGFLLCRSFMFFTNDGLPPSNKLERIVFSWSPVFIGSLGLFFFFWWHEFMVRELTEAPTIRDFCQRILLSLKSPEAAKLK